MSSPEPTSEASPPARRRRYRKPLAIAAGVLALLYVALGFLLAPRLVRDAIQEKGSAALHRTVHVTEVKVNPLVLSVTVDGLTVAQPTGGQLFAWDSLYVRLAPWKVLFGDVGVAQIVLVRPRATLGLDAAGRLDIQDLLEPDPSAPEPPPGAPPKRALGIALDRLEIVEASLTFHDDTRAPRFETILGPLTVRLSKFRTRGGADSPYAFTGVTEAGESFSWSGTLQSEPLRSSGSVSFTGVSLPKYGAYTVDGAPALLVQSGKLGLDARYDLAWGAAARKLALSAISVTVDDLTLARRRDGSVAATLPRIEVKGGEVDLLGRSASIAEVLVAGGRLTPRRDPDGNMALVEMLETAPPKPGGAAGPAWRWKIGSVSIEKIEVEAEDQTTRRPVKVSLPEVNIRLTGLDERPETPCALTARARVGAGGTVEIDGTVWPLAPRANLALKATAIDLLPLAPYVETGAPVRLAAAQLELDTRVEVDASGSEAAWSLAGSVSLDGLRLRHPTREEDLVQWRSLRVEGIDAQSAARRAGVKMVRLVEPRIRGIVFEDGSTGLQPAAGAASTTATRDGGKAGAGPSAPGSAGTWRTSLALFQVVRGRLSFVDRSVAPPVLLALEDIEGRIASLSSDPRARSTVEMKARMGSAPVAVLGTFNPLQATAYTDLAISTKGVELTPLGPYSAKYVGYLLEKGKLDLELAYRVRARALTAANVVRIDQLTLGEHVDSPDATSAPVKLGLALLRDKDGVILLDVPVEGDLDDPEFHYGRVVWRAIGNLIVKLATSPFSALASLVGGGKEDISLVEFTPGESRLLDAGAHRVQLLASALRERPGLSLELEGSADPAADGLALRRVELDRNLRSLKAQLAGVSPGSVTVAPDERPALVERAWRAAFPPKPAPAGQPAPSPTTPAAMEDQLLAAVPIPPEALKALALERGEVVRDALLAAGLDRARLFTVEGSERAAKEPGPRAYFTVK